MLLFSLASSLFDFLLQGRIEENRKKLAGISNHLYRLSTERNNEITIGDNSLDLLAKRQIDALGMQTGIAISNGDRDSHSYQEDTHASSTIHGFGVPVKNAVRPIKLAEVKRLPPYTTWIFLDRCVRK